MDKIPIFNKDESLVLKNLQQGISLRLDSLREIIRNDQENLIEYFILMNLTNQNISLKDFLEDFEKKLIEKVLLCFEGNQTKAASFMGIKYSTLYEKIRRIQSNHARSS